MQIAQIILIVIVIALYVKWFHYAHDCVTANANEALLIAACLSILFCITMYLFYFAGALSRIF